MVVQTELVCNSQKICRRWIYKLTGGSYTYIESITPQVLNTCDNTCGVIGDYWNGHPRRACAAMVVLCVCVCVCFSPRLLVAQPRDKTNGSVSWSLQNEFSVFL